MQRSRIAMKQSLVTADGAIRANRGAHGASSHTGDTALPWKHSPLMTWIRGVKVSVADAQPDFPGWDTTQATSQVRQPMHLLRLQ